MTNGDAPIPQCESTKQSAAVILQSGSVVAASASRTAWPAAALPRLAVSCLSRARTVKAPASVEELAVVAPLDLAGVALRIDCKHAGRPDHDVVDVRLAALNPPIV